MKKLQDEIDEKRYEEDAYEREYQEDERLRSLNWIKDTRYIHGGEIHVYLCTICGEDTRTNPTSKHDLQACFEKMMDRIKTHLRLDREDDDC